jgi:hypothetical protein
MTSKAFGIRWLCGLVYRLAAERGIAEALIEVAIE